MALKFDIQETANGNLRFNVKGHDIELDLNAAGSLCNSITQFLMDKKFPIYPVQKFYYWYCKCIKGERLKLKLTPGQYKAYEDYCAKKTKRAKRKWKTL